MLEDTMPRRRTTPRRRLTCSCPTIGMPNFTEHGSSIVAYCPKCKGDIAQVALHLRAKPKVFAHPGPTWDLWASWILKEALIATR